jgi:hypothetical protein
MLREGTFSEEEQELGLATPGRKRPAPTIKNRNRDSTLFFRLFFNDSKKTIFSRISFNNLIAKNCD